MKSTTMAEVRKSGDDRLYGVCCADDVLQNWTEKELREFLENAVPQLPDEMEVPIVDVPGPTIQSLFVAYDNGLLIAPYYVGDQFRVYVKRTPKVMAHDGQNRTSAK